MTVTNDQIIQAVFTAAPENKPRALLILQGKEPDPKSAPLDGPLLMGMGDSAKLMGLSRATLWRMIRDGRLEKVEIYHNAFRLRRSDILALVQGRDPAPAGSRPLSSTPNPQPQTSNHTSPEVSHG